MRRITAERWVGMAAAAAFTAAMAIWGINAVFVRSAVAGVVVLLTVSFFSRDWRPLLVFAMFLPIGVMASTLVNVLILHLHLHLIDGELSALGFGLGAKVYHWCAAHPPVYRFFYVVYDNLPMAVALLLCFAEEKAKCIACIAMATILAPVFYIAFPAVGPAAVGDPAGFRNCMPSLHLTWAILPVFFVRGRARMVGLLFAALTGIAILATGEHYILDGLAAIVYCFATVAVVQRAQRSRPTERMPEAYAPDIVAEG